MNGPLSGPSSTVCCSEIGYGSISCNSNGRVIGVSYTAKGFSGAIYSGLIGLIYLVSLNLSSNALTGSIPAFDSIANLTTLYFMHN